MKVAKTLRGAALVVLMGLAGCASDFGLTQADAEPDSALQDKQALGYAVALNGLESAPDIAETVRAVSRTFKLAERGVASEAGLERRAERDLPDMHRVLKAEGYYDATVSASVVDAPPQQLTVTFTAVPGTRYTLGLFETQFEPAADNLPSAAQLLAAARLVTGAPATGRAIIAAEAEILTFLKRKGFPDARFLDRRAEVQSDRARLNVSSRFDPGQFTTFGELGISENSSLEPAYIRKLVPWKPGEIWDQYKIEAFQTDLKASGLFSSVSLKPRPSAEGAPQREQRDLLLDVENAKQRSVGGSLRYDTDQGAGVRLSWRHRNLFGRAEDVRAEADMLLDEQKLSLGMTRPQHPARNWSSNESIVLRRLDDEAFEERSVTLRTGLELAAGEGWTLGGSIEGSAAQNDTDFASETAYLIGLPLFAKRDRTDNPLDATTGYRLSLTAGPFIGLNNGTPLHFSVLGGGGSVYVPLIGKNRLVLAMRTRVSSILSRDVDDVPVNQRLFGGGGASVRGFEFQSISPANGQNDLTGGRFLNENSVELRLRLAEEFGVVGFVDSGIVEEEPFPSFQERMNVGVGGGFRYYSPVGPLRFDLAFPLARRAGDNLFEFYISLGQAF